VVTGGVVVGSVVVVGGLVVVVSGGVLVRGGWEVVVGVVVVVVAGGVVVAVVVTGGVVVAVVGAGAVVVGDVVVSVGWVEVVAVPPEQAAATGSTTSRMTRKMPISILLIMDRLPTCRYTFFYSASYTMLDNIFSGTVCQSFFRQKNYL